MSNFAPKLQDSKDDQLWHLINESSPHYGSLASDQLTRRALNKLRKTICIFNEQSSKQTKRLVKLTWWIVVLTIILVIGLVIQIYLAKIQTAPVLLEQERNERRAYEICKNNPKGEYTGLTGALTKCQEVFDILQDKFE